MSSIQERLQLKRVPLDTWNIREQLSLASAVVRSGDQNWMSVSRALKTVGEPNRPQDWYSQKSCAAQYGALLEHVETPKRKKRSSEGAVETPQESILKKLTQERIVEIQKTLAEMNQQYDHLKNELLEVNNSSTSDERIKELWTNMEARTRAREREAARRVAWMKERDERRARADRTWRPQGQAMPATSNPVATPAPPSSPLLTSLLKSSPVVTTPQHMPHPANVVDTMSPSVTAPTLSMLLEKCAPATQHDNKHAAIEHIKSQLVQIEHQLKANNPTPVALPPTAPAEATPALDIDDIEIKAEDVYAFQDIDLHIPPVTTMHKPNNRVPDKPASKTEDEEVPEVAESEAEPVAEVKEEVEQMDVDVTLEEVPVAEVTETQPPEQPEVQQETPEPAQEAEIKIAFPEVKFPTTEIKVIQPDEQKIKEELKEAEEPTPETTEEPEASLPAPEVEENPPPVVQEPVVELPVEPEPEVRPDPEPQTETPPEETQKKETAVEEIPLPVVNMADIPLPLGAAPEVTTDVTTAVTTAEEPEVEEPPPIKEEEAPPEPEVSIEQKLEMMEKGTLEPTPEPEPKKIEEDLKREDDSEDSIPLKEMLIKEEIAQAEAEAKAEKPKVEEETAERPKDEKPNAERPNTEPEDTHTETDDDTPMELSREEEKDGKKKRDYSRKKKSDSRTWSGSESAAEASAPESPSASDAERHHRLWRKSVMLVYSRLCAHKYASLFLRPITDEEAPGYSRVVRRPMDLTTIRRHIDAGLIRTTAEFQRDVLLMLTNALMYNSSEHSVYTMAREMHKEAQCQLGMLVAAQAHAALVDAAPATRKRRRHDESPAAEKRHH